MIDSIDKVNALISENNCIQHFLTSQNLKLEDCGSANQELFVMKMLGVPSDHIRKIMSLLILGINLFVKESGNLFLQFNAKTEEEAEFSKYLSEEMP